MIYHKLSNSNYSSIENCENPQSRFHKATYFRFEDVGLALELESSTKVILCHQNINKKQGNSQL